MSRSQLVAEHLPLLRRYARALTGNQASGDAYVGRHAGSPAAGRLPARRTAWPARRSVQAFHPDLEFGLAQRQPRRRDAGAAAGAAGSRTSRRCRGRRSCCSRWKASPRRRWRSSSTSTSPRPAGVDGDRRPRDGGGNRHRRPDHRGRDLYRDGPREPREKPRPQRDRRRPHPCRCGGAGQEQEARPDPRRHPSSPTALRAWTRSTSC